MTRTPRGTQPAPDVLPLLGRGKHRSPRKGACFMELASYLAGERWSDHPTCTHPLLAALARQVNDLTSDAGRSLLAPHIPSVIGVNGDDARLDALVALRCATSAMPVAAEERQRALAVSALVADRVLADLEGRRAVDLRPETEDALASAPLAEAWARSFAGRFEPSLSEFRGRSAPSTVRLSTTGVAAACVPDPDGLLREMLVGAVADCAALCDRARRPAAPDWATVVERLRLSRAR